MTKSKYVGVTIFIEKKKDTYDKLTVLAEGVRALLFASSKIKILVDHMGYSKNPNLYHQYKPLMNTTKFKALKKLSEKLVFHPKANTFPKETPCLYKSASLKEFKTASGRNMIEIYIPTTDIAHADAIEGTLIPVVNTLFKNEVYSIAVRSGSDTQTFDDCKKYMV